MPVRLGGSALLLEGAAERLVGIVVGRVKLVGDRTELPFRFLPAGQPEVGDAERLANRRLLRFEPLCLLERDGRLGGEAAPEALLAFAEELVGVAHRR